MSVSKLLDEIQEELGIDGGVEANCDGCATSLSQEDESYSEYIDPMVMVLCAECAEDAGWLDE